MRPRWSIGFRVPMNCRPGRRLTAAIVPANPASTVRGPKHVVKTGKTPVLEAEEWRKLLDSIPAVTLRDLRDRALIATLTYSFARYGSNGGSKNQRLFTGFKYLEQLTE
jgi:hypothetical protein